MARSTVGKLVTKTAGAAAKAGASVAKKAMPGKKDAATTMPVSPPRKRTGKAGSGEEAKPAKKATAPAKTAPAKKAVAKKAVAKKAVAKKTVAKKTVAKKAPAPPAKKTSVRKASVGKTSTAARRKVAPVTDQPAVLAVKADEEPWTEAELGEVRAELSADVERLQQELSLANNARHMLTQTQHARERIDDGSYGVCESCGQPIGKNRLMAYPRATLCLSCKQREERR